MHGADPEPVVVIGVLIEFAVYSSSLLRNT